MIVVQLYYRWQLQGLESFKTLFNMYKNEGIFPPRNKVSITLYTLYTSLNVLLSIKLSVTHNVYNW